MAQKAVEALAKKLEHDPALRAEFRKDPEGVARRLGIEFTESERKAVHKIDWKKMTDEEHVARLHQPYIIEWHSL